MENNGFLRRKDAAQYLLGKYGFGAERTLCKGVVTGDSPQYRKAGRLVLYRRDDLDTWAMAKIGAPQRSSSDVPVASASGFEASSKPCDR